MYLEIVLENVSVCQNIATSCPTYFLNPCHCWIAECSLSHN